MTSPNPMVGAVVVRDGKILGQGYHRRAGEPHAEIAALTQAGEAARGATLFVNLEPCVHHGRTPPCTDAILAAGVAEVVASMQDPDARVDGRGFRRLEAAGVRIRRGILEAEARRLNEKFVKHATTGLPFVTLKAGMTLDGRIAAASGSPRWITSEEARAEGHRLRYENDAILVGVETVLSDDPVLTARWGPGKPLVRAVLDSRLRTPPDARILDEAHGGPVILYAHRGESPDGPGSRVLRERAEVVPVGGAPGRLDWREVLADLGRRQVIGLLVEGGGRVLGSALAAGVVDRLVLFVAPRILGDAGVPAFAGLPPGEPLAGFVLDEVEWRRAGPDWRIEGRPRRAGES
jgi:diaminohydroxyphosphoribosylaminopyrimidine deaminase/5-amino-6-(5-phosphoribosylamino)uracil reductase